MSVLVSISRSEVRILDFVVEMSLVPSTSLCNDPPNVVS